MYEMFHPRKKNEPTDVSSSSIIKTGHLAPGGNIIVVVIVVFVAEQLKQNWLFHMLGNSQK